MEAMLTAEKMSTTTTATTTQTEQTGEGEAGLQKPQTKKKTACRHSQEAKQLRKTSTDTCNLPSLKLTQAPRMVEDSL